MTMRRNRMWWRAALIIPGLIVLSGLTAQASPSSASVPNRQVVSASSLSTSDDKGVTVTCPAGTQRLASGADVAGAGSAYVVIDDIIPGPRNVTAYGYEYHYGTTATWSIRAWAVCGALSTTVYTYAQSSAYNINDSKTADVSCPAGMVVLGTGYALLSAGGDALVHEVTPTSNSVHVEAYEVDLNGLIGNWSVTAYAICAADPGGRSQVSATSVTNSDPDRHGIATCPAGKEAFGIGFNLNGFLGRLNVDDLIPTSVGNILSHANELVATTNNWSITTTAICATA